MNYEKLNIVDSSTSQATMQNTRPRNKSSLQLRKRPQKFTNQEKIDAINRIHDGEHKMAVARDINVPESTLRGWCKLEKKIRSQLNNFLRTSENYKHIPITSSSDNNDNNSTIGTVSMSNISAVSDPFLRNQLLQSYFYNQQLANSAVMKAYLDLYNSSLSISGQSLPTANFSNDGPYMHRSNDVNSDVTMTNMTLASNTLVNTNSAPIHTENPTVLNNPKGASSRKQNYQSPYTKESSESIPQISNRRLSNSLPPEFFDPSRSISQPTNSRISLVPLTSRNNDVVTTISSKSSKLRKTLSVAVCQQQQRFISAVPGYNTRKKNMFNNVAINNNNSNNNNNHVNNEINNRRLSNSLSSKFFDPSRSTSQPTNSRTSPSTSRNNSEVVSTISSKSSQNRKKLSTIVYQLQQGFLPPVPGTGEENMFDSNNNNNDVDYVDNETSNRNSSSLPPDFSETLSCCIKLLEWLENHGSAVCTFQQVAQIRRVLDNLINFANSKKRS